MRRPGEARAALDRLHEGLEAEIAARAGLTDGTGDSGRDYVLWREAARRVLTQADATAEDEGRYRPHLDAVPALRGGIAQAGAELKGMLDADDAVLPILDEWRALEGRAEAAGTHWYREHGREDVLRRLEAAPDLPQLDSALSEGMAAIVAEGRSIAMAEAAADPLAARLRDCIEERARLVDEAGYLRATCSSRPPLTAWRTEARALLEEARRLVEEDGPFARHGHALPELREAIAADRKLLEGAVSLDERHAACLADMLEIVKRETDTPLFYRAGHGAVVERMRPLAADPGLNEDARALLDRLIERHDTAAAERSEVERLQTGLRSCLEYRRKLAEMTAGRISMTDTGSTYSLWAEDAGRLCRTAERILSGERYGDHLDRIANAQIEIGEGAARLAQALETDAAYRELAPKLIRTPGDAAGQEEVLRDAQAMLERPELDSGAEAVLRRHIERHEQAAARARIRAAEAAGLTRRQESQQQQDERRTIDRSEGGGISM